MAPDHVQQPTAGTPVTVVLGNREVPLNKLFEITVQRTHKDINFRFEEATRVSEFVRLATRPETRLAMFIPPGNLERDPDVSFATPEVEAVRIVKAIKANNDIPVIVMAVQPHAREMVVNAGASLCLDIPAQAQQLVDAFAECLGLAPRMIAP
jgi:hypothetical protein